MDGHNSKPSSYSEQRPKQPSAALSVANQPQAAAAAAAVAVPNNPEVALIPFDPITKSLPNISRDAWTIVEGYLDNDIQISSAEVARHSIFTQGDALLIYQASVIARDHVLTAGPLAALEAAVRKNPNVLLPQIRITMKLAGEDINLRGTLEELAMMLLDQTIVSDEGMAECLRKLRETLLPPLSLKPSIAAEEKKDENLEATHLEVLNQIFEAIKRDNFASARAQMKAYMKSLKPVVITDNKYFLNLLQLIPLAFKVLIGRVQELNNTWYGNQADQYCYTTAGVIETALSFVLRKRLKRGIYYLLNKGANIDRATDATDASFIGRPGSNFELGVNVFFNDLYPGQAARCGLASGQFMAVVARVFFKLISAITSAQQNLCSDRTLNRRTAP